MLLSGVLNLGKLLKLFNSMSILSMAFNGILKASIWLRLAKIGKWLCSIKSSSLLLEKKYMLELSFV